MTNGGFRDGPYHGAACSVLVALGSVTMAVVDSLFVTLKRGLQGVRADHRGIVQSLGLRYRMQTVERLNTAPVRNSIYKIRHLLRVETNVQRAERLAAEAEAIKLRSPVVVKH